MLRECSLRKNKNVFPFVALCLNFLIFCIMTNSIQKSSLENVILKYYNLGELVNCEELYLGYVNESYIIEVAHNGKKKKYFIRKYKRGIKEEEIIFEHSIINHLVKKNFHLVAKAIPAKDGKTYLKQPEKGDDIFYAIFEFLEGEDKYTWVNPSCDEKDLKEAAMALAQYHNAVYDLNPAGKRNEAKIIELLPKISQKTALLAQKSGTTTFDTLFLEKLPSILEVIERRISAIDRQEYEALPHLAIHSDYHPGNLKFQDDKVVGLFDFDWSKMDARCFDIALALTYFCIAWDGEKDGNLQLDQVAIFLQTYQQTLENSDGLSPMNSAELDYLPDMISASILYVLNWVIKDFYKQDADSPEYLSYLEHALRSIDWLEKKQNWEKLEQIIRNTRNELFI